MPELPEVETAARNLRRWTAGRKVVEVILLDRAVVRRGLSTSARDADPEGAVVLEAAHGPLTVLRRGKRLGLRLGDTPILAHLGMTGRFVRQQDAPKHARAQLVLDDGPPIFFADARRFGGLATVTGTLEDAVAAGLGPDALDTPLDGPALRKALDARGPLKPLLMDQARIAGLGNIHAAEALWWARLSPFAPGRSLTPASADALAAAITRQLTFALDEVASDEVAYLSDGAHVANPFQVYGREGEACSACGTPILRDVQGGRSTFWCPTCQPLSPAQA